MRQSRSPLERVVSFGTALLDAGRGKTLTKSFVLDGLGLSLSDKQIPQVVENLESGRKPREAWEAVVVLRRQAIEKGARDEPQEPDAPEQLGIRPRDGAISPLRRFRSLAGSFTELPRSAPRLGAQKFEVYIGPPGRAGFRRIHVK